MVHRQRFLILSLSNWALAIVLWSISAYLGITSPTSLFVYSVLFVVALIAVVVGVLSWLVWRFGREPGAAAGERSVEVTDQPPPFPGQ
jgi:heme/copper-type cytochrome/quinol oxidase subunit 2